MKKRKVDEETIADTRMPSKMRRLMNTWREYISHEIDISKEFNPNFNFQKIHLMAHWVEQICRYRPLHQHSGEGHDQAHETNLKDGWNASNHNLNHQPQEFTTQHPILCFVIRERNFQALAQRQENSAATCKVLPSGRDLAAPLSSQSYAKPEFMGPQKCHDGKHPDTMIKDFRALLGNTQNTMRHVTMYTGTQECIKHKSHIKTYISDEQLHTMELCIYHGIQVEVEGSEGESISQIFQCTGSQSWRRADRRNDWVWEKQHPGR